MNAEIGTSFSLMTIICTRVGNKSTLDHQSDAMAVNLLGNELEVISLHRLMKKYKKIVKNQ